MLYINNKVISNKIIYTKTLMQMIMNFKKFWSMFKIKESLKSNRLDDILDKMSRGEVLTQSEKQFLDDYDKTSDEDIRDYKMLDKESTFDIVKKMIDSGKNVICNITDRDGKIGIKVKSIRNFLGEEKCTITLINGKEIFLLDKMLYNIIYNDGDYSLEVGDEFFEKIPVRDESS